MRPAVYILVIVAATLFARCSPEANSVTSKAFHNITAHYNGYYYALEEITKIETTIEESRSDDYNRILTLFPSFDSSMAKGYEKEIEEAIKMASIAIQRHPNSKWVDDAYILVGKARHYSLDWGNAIETFKYVNTKSEDPDARHRAIVNLIRTFTVHGEFNNARAAMDYLLKENLSKTNLKDLYLEIAYFHQVQDDYDNMVRSLAKAAPLLTKKDPRGRIYFILGQVYQKLGFESEAYNHYKKTLATNPPYELDFYARLYMAQVAEISRSKDVASARKSFKKLLKDRKNKDFKDKIFYEMGLFESKQDNLQQAISNYNLAIREGTNTRVDGEAYLRLGEIYYDTVKNYELSQAYYDSAISSLPTDYENYAAIKKRQEILNEFVKNLKVIQWQDSLLEMASLDSVTLRARIDSLVTAKRQQEELAAAAQKKKRRNRIEIEATETNIFNSGEEAGGTGDWYFGNPSAIALGQLEFVRTWGDIPLEDNWRRSGRVAEGTSGPAVTGSAEETGANETGDEADTPAADPVDTEFARISQELPRTEEQKQEALKKIEDAYFNVGDIYYFDLQEKLNARDSYLTLLQRFPTSEYEPEVLYKLYLINKELDNALAEQYAEELKRDFPHSSFAKILENPNYLQENHQAAEKQKQFYKEAYEHYQNENYVGALSILKDAEALGTTAFSPKLELLNVLITGRTEDISKYQYALGSFIENHPESDVTPYAEKLLASSHEFALNQEKQRSTKFVKSFDGPHYFVMVHRKGDNLSNTASRALETFNKDNFKDRGLNTSTLSLNDDLVMTIVSGLEGKQSASKYYQMFAENQNSLLELRNHKFNNFVITKDNFNIFYRTKSLDEYLVFFEKNYLAENQ